jgi:hypothetical protein
LSGTWYQVSGLSITQLGLQCPVIASILKYRKNVLMCQEYVKTGTAVVLFEPFFSSL